MAVSKDSIYVNSGLTYRSTDELITDVGLLNSSLTSIFSVEIKANGKQFARNISLERVNFLGYEAVLPGRSFQTGEVVNNIQGVTEKYPTLSTYPDVDVSFYITREYNTLEFFNEWMSSISPVVNKASPTGYTKFSYPDSYECNVNIVKYERDLRSKFQRLNSKGRSTASINPYTYTHTLINAYPINMISIPVSYSQSDILRTTITFNYDRYLVQQNKVINEDSIFGSSLNTQQPQTRNQGANPANTNNSTRVQRVDRRVEAGLPGVGRVNFAEPSIFDPNFDFETNTLRQ